MNTKEAVTFWGVNNGKLQNLVVLDKRINGTVRATQSQRTIEGNIRDRFVGSRRITIENPELMELLKPLLADKTEFNVNVAGVWTSEAKDKKVNGEVVTVWYDNQIVTELTIL